MPNRSNYSAEGLEREKAQNAARIRALNRLGRENPKKLREYYEEEVAKIYDERNIDGTSRSNSPDLKFRTRHRSEV
jgi:hypothetical protein